MHFRLLQKYHSFRWLDNYINDNTKKMRIFIVGYMYSGKTSIGQRLAKKLGVKFFDTDTLFESRFRISIYDFLQRYDEPTFRKLEHEVLLSTTKFDDCVISTGGGTPCFYDNMDFMCATGLTVYLESSTNLILSRHAKSNKTRPLLEGLSHNELEAFVQHHLDKRKPFYERATLRFNAIDSNIDTLYKAVSENLTDI